ncbi:MAG TPA: hypothetical protein VGE63_00595 [Candidatus Paceibacterota bacterium]
MEKRKSLFWINFYYIVLIVGLATVSFAIKETRIPLGTVFSFFGGISAAIVLSFLTANAKSFIHCILLIGGFCLVWFSYTLFKEAFWLSITLGLTTLICSYLEYRRQFEYKYLN